MLAQAFSDNAIKQMERYVLANARTFCEVIGTGADDGPGGVVDGVGGNAGVVAEKKGWSGAKNMSYWCSYLAMDILGDLCFGKAFRMLESPENRFALDLVIVATTRHLIVSPLPFPFFPFCAGRSLTRAVRHHAHHRQARHRQVPLP